MVLHRFPLQRRADEGRVAYRVTSLDQLSIASGIFDLDEYGSALGDSPVTAFIDLGCNSGLFTLWLAARRASTITKGLLVDANPMMVAEARWHLAKNGIEGCEVVQGAVGLPPERQTTVFHVHQSSSASSVLDYHSGAQVPTKGRIAEMVVPAVLVGREWRSRFGDAKVDLMKVDVEGAELGLITNERDFIKERVRKIVMEWHKWSVSLAELDSTLASLGFAKIGVFDDADFTGLVAYENAAMTG